MWIVNKLEAKGRKNQTDFEKKQCLILPKLLPQASVLRVSSNRFFYLCFLIPPEESQADHAQLITRLQSLTCTPEKQKGASIPMNQQHPGDI